MAENTNTDELRKTIDLEVWRLLPWLANDSLEGEELERVLDHLKESSECRRELLFLSELRHATELASDERLEPSQQRLDRLMTRIDRFESERSATQQVPPTSPQAVPAASDANRRRTSSRRLFLAQAAVLAALVGALVWTLVSGGVSPGIGEGPPGFRTLSVDATGAEHARELPGPRLRLIFEDGVEERQLRTLLFDAGAEIVAGPTALGVYTVELSADGEAGTEVLVEALRQDPRIAFVEPVFEPEVSGRERAP